MIDYGTPLEMDSHDPKTYFFSKNCKNLNWKLERGRGRWTEVMIVLYPRGQIECCAPVTLD